MNIRTMRTAACLLAVACLLACQSPLGYTKEASTQINEFLAGASPAIDGFVARGVISPEEAQAKKDSIARIAAAYSPLDAKIQSLAQLDASAAINLLPDAEHFVSVLQAEHVVKLPSNPEAAKWYQTAAALLETVGARLVARLKSKAAGAGEGSSELRRLRDENDKDLARLKGLLMPADAFAGR